MVNSKEKQLFQISVWAENIKSEVEKIQEEEKLKRQYLVDFFKKMTNEEKFETFCYAVLEENKEFCKILLDSGFDINHRCRRNTTFCHHDHYHTVLTSLTMVTSRPREIACFNKIITPEMAQWLIDNGADVNTSSICKEDTPLYYACESNNYQLAEVYLKNGSIINDEIFEIIIEKNVSESLLKAVLKEMKK